MEKEDNDLLKQQWLILSNMDKITLLAIVAILTGTAILTTAGSTVITSVVAQTMDNATMAGNMTGGNMTGGNMTSENATGTISGHR